MQSISLKKITSQILPFFILAALSIGLHNPANAQKVSWTKYQSDEAKIKAKFPGEHEASKTDTEYGTTYKIQSQSGEMLFFIGSTHHKNALENVDELTQVGMDAFAESMGGMIQSQSDWEYKKLTGRRGLMSVPGKDAIIDYRTVISGEYQYQFIALGPKKDFDDDLSAKFFKGIKLIKQ